MKNHFAILLIVLSTITASAQTPEPPPLPAKELSTRDGLPNFLAKASKAGAELRVAYLGGSITAQPGWRVKSLQLLRNTFPSANFIEINAALGGTGSDLGVFRLGPEVLDKKPDLLFVEFAVNDGGAAPEQIVRSMEGIVRKTWRAFPECDICFVYTVTEALVEPMLHGHFPRAAGTMERVADHYGIPTVHMGMEVARLAKEGRLLWKAKLPGSAEEKAATGDKLVFAPDSVHPHVETGHALYTQALERALPALRDASPDPKPHSLGNPLMQDNYEQARMVPLSNAMLSGGFRPLSEANDALAKRFPRLPNGAVASQAGATLAFRFKGTRAALYQMIGPDSGQVTVRVDENPPRTVALFDSYCSSYRLSTLGIGSELPDATHSVRIEIHPEEPDKAAILAKRNQQMDDREKYKGTSFYPGALLLLGELVEP
jgi:hypothetical protein